MTEHAHEHYEPGGVHTSYVLTAATGCFALMVGAVGILYLIYHAAVPHPQPEPPRLFPAPRLEADPAAELHQLLAKQRAEMSGYRWANRAHTLVAIPIDEAMKLIAARGARAFDPIPSAPIELPPGSPPLVPPIQNAPPPAKSAQEQTSGQIPPAQGLSPKQAPPPRAQP
jgi:hypothetical protein